MNGEVNNCVDSDMPGGDEAVVQSRLIDRHVLLACGGVLVDFAGEALCQNLQLHGTRGAIEAIADALRGSLAGDALLVSGAARSFHRRRPLSLSLCILHMMEPPRRSLRRR
jgi:hypothetical protein